MRTFLQQAVLDSFADKATPEQLEHLVMFWESFPNCQARILALFAVFKRDNPPVEIVPPGADDDEAIPAVAKLVDANCLNVRTENGAHVWRDEGRDGFVRLQVAGNPFTVAAAFHDDGRVAEIHLLILEGMHRRVEDALCRELERKGLDSSRIRQSGSVCRAVSPSDIARPWPDCLGGNFSTLAPHDQVAVLDAKRILERFALQLQLGRAENAPPAGWAFTPGKAVYNGTEFSISGVEAAFLRRFVEARRPQGYADLKGLCPDDLVTDVTVRACLSELRKTLRKALGLGKLDPLPRVAKGKDQTAWRLADEVLPIVGKNQR